MNTESSVLTEGFQLHTAGKLAEAAEKYRQVLATTPNNSEAWALLGAASLSLGRLNDAIAHLREALRLNSNHAGAHDNLGVALAKSGRLEEAVAHLRKAVWLRPQQAETWGNLGKALVMQGQFAEAVDVLRGALKAKADSPVLYFHLAQALTRQGRFDEAVDTYRTALKIKPDYVTSMVNLGSVLCELGRPDEAEAVLRDALRLNQNLSQTWNNLGSALIRQNRFVDAEATLRKAVALSPGDADPHYNLGFVLLKQSRPHDALECFTRAVDLRPDYAKAHFNRSVTWLLLGDFGRGWPEYEWRWQCSEFAPRTFPQPRWDGSSLNGRTIYLFAEQGLGDTLQFIRYASHVKARGGRVIIESPSALAPLLSRTPGIDEVIEAGSPIPSFDVQAPLMSLPLILGTRPDAVPDKIPYVFPDPDFVENRRRELESYAGLKVGLAWQGNPRYRDDRLRSISLMQFEPLARTPGIHLISLQRGPGTDHLHDLPAWFKVVDLGCSSNDKDWSFMDTAGVISNLDLVIACDTVVAHLAGSLGVPVWVILPTAPDWRWFLEREDSPWYPTMKLFRQSEQGEWASVMTRIAAALKTVVRRAP